MGYAKGSLCLCPMSRVKSDRWSTYGKKRKHVKARSLRMRWVSGGGSIQARRIAVLSLQPLLRTGGHPLAPRLTSTASPCRFPGPVISGRTTSEKATQEVLMAPERTCKPRVVVGNLVLRHGKYFNPPNLAQSRNHGVEIHHTESSNQKLPWLAERRKPMKWASHCLLKVKTFQSPVRRHQCWDL